MQKRIIIIILFLAAISLIIVNSCFEEDSPVLPHQPGQEETFEFERSIYYYQSYYDLSTNKVVQYNENSEWLLGFEATGNGWRIIVNSSDYWAVQNTGISEFNQVSPDPDPDSWIFDSSGGNPDSTAAGSWVLFTEDDTVYSGSLYLLGHYNGITYIPEWKFIFDFVDKYEYRFRYSDMDDTIPVNYQLLKNLDYNYIYFNPENGGMTLIMEPPKNNWDLLFTQYGSILYTREGVPTPFFVRGVYLNKAGVTVTIDTVKSFNDIDFNELARYNFSDRQDFIGYDWKAVTVDLQSNTAVYTVNSNYTYIIRDMEGFYYKLRFISYYNNLGEKGYPAFEFVKL